MSSPPGVKLGPLTTQIAANARWLSQDEFPSRQNWADDVEQLLNFLVAQNWFEACLPRLRDVNAEQRDAMLAEIRVAKFLVESGIEVVEWEPTAGLVRLATNHDVPPVFVEIKAPGWRGELTKGMATATQNGARRSHCAGEPRKIHQR